MNNICFLIPGLNAGGIENYLLRFLSFFPDEKNFTVLVRNKKKGDLYDEYKKTGVNIRFQEVGFLNPFKWYLLYIYFKNQKFKTICDFNGNFAGIVLIIARFAGIQKRIVFYRRSSNAFKETWFNLKYNYFVNKLVYKNATKILSNSQHAIDFFFPNRCISDNRFKVISNGIKLSAYKIKETKKEARSFFNLPLNKFIIGHIGRYDPAKNHETIFMLAKKIKQDKQNICFLFAGKYTDSQEFLKRVEFHGIEDICICLGLQTRLPLLYKAMDLFYFPSLTEGQPNALIEAMAAGIPFITSNIPPIKEMIPKSVHSNLIDPLDFNSALEIINEVQQNENYSKKMIFNNEILKRFSEEETFKIFFYEL